MKSIALTEAAVIAAADDIAREALVILAARRAARAADDETDFTEEAIGADEMDAALRDAVRERLQEMEQKDDTK